MKLAFGMHSINCAGNAIAKSKTIALRIISQTLMNLDSMYLDMLARKIIFWLLKYCEKMFKNVLLGATEVKYRKKVNMLTVLGPLVKRYLKLTILSLKINLNENRVSDLTIISLQNGWLNCPYESFIQLNQSHFPARWRRTSWLYDHLKWNEHVDNI